MYAQPEFKKIRIAGQRPGADSVKLVDSYPFGLEYLSRTSRNQKGILLILCYYGTTYRKI